MFCLNRKSIPGIHDQGLICDMTTYDLQNNIHYLEAFFVEPDPEANVDINLLICYTTRTDHIYLERHRLGQETY